MAGLTVAVRYRDTSPVRMVYSRNADLSEPEYTDTQSTPGVLKFAATDPDAGELYYYNFERAGQLLMPVHGTAKTPAVGAHSFQCWFGNCMNGGDHPIFDAIAAKGWDFGLQDGDFQYVNIIQNEPKRFHDAYDVIFRATAFERLAASMPIFYIPDDHDRNGNSSNKASTGRDAVNTAFRQRVPFTDMLVESGSADALYYKITRGRVVFLVTDQRSEKEGTTILGATQKTWFLNELTSNPGKLIVWVSPTVPHGDSGGDGWEGAADERIEIWNAIKAAGIAGRFLIMGGDMHAVAVALAVDYATGGGAAVRLIHAGPLNQTNGVKGGPYDLTFDDNNNQVGLLEITDTGGDEITVGFTGYEYDAGVAGSLAELVDLEWQYDLAA